MAETSSICSTAISYANLGWPILPLWSARDGRCDCGKPDCASPGKHPQGRFAPHGLKDATRDGNTIYGWFADEHLVNVGVLTGPESGIVVLDIDPRHGGEESLKTLGPMPDTATVETGGGGRHLYFRYPEGAKIRNSGGKLGPGLDIRGAGGYAVAPPSLHASGQAYRWLRDPRTGLADLPEHILEKLIGKPAPVTASQPIGPVIPKGQRDSTLTSLAGTMRRRGVTEAGILAVLREQNKCCEEPLPDVDLQRIARSIGKREPGQPVGRPKGEPLRLEEAVPFPVKALPEPVARFVNEAARAIGCDPSFIAVPLLVGFASAIGNTRRIQLKRGWTEPAIIWAAIVADSGTLKSPALELALKSIRKRQHVAMQRYHEAMEHYEQEMLNHEKELAAWKRNKDSGDPPVKPKEPVAEEFWTADATMEAVAAMLVNNRRGLLVAPDELATWLCSFDRYAQGKGGDAAHWLEMHGGRMLKINRKTGHPRILYVPRAAVSIVGGIQPETLHRALGKEHRENGLAARLLVTCPPRRSKRWTEADIDPAAEARIGAIFDWLYDLDFEIDSQGELGPVMLCLTPDGKAEWVEFFNAHAKEHETLTGELSAAWSKLEGYTARFALVIHLVRRAINDPTLAAMDKIDAQSVRVGVSLSQWFGSEARRAYAILDESDEQRDQRRLIELIERKGGSVTVRDLMRSARRFRTADDAEQALQELVQAGHGRWETLPPGPDGGQPTRRFVLAPPVDADTTSTSSRVSGVLSTSTRADGSEEQEERAAIREYDGGLTREEAEQQARTEVQVRHDAK